MGFEQQLIELFADAYEPLIVTGCLFLMLILVLVFQHPRKSLFEYRSVCHGLASDFTRPQVLMQSLLCYWQQLFVSVRSFF